MGRGYKQVVEGGYNDKALCTSSNNKKKKTSILKEIEKASLGNNGII